MSFRPLLLTLVPLTLPLAATAGSSCYANSGQSFQQLKGYYYQDTDMNAGVRADINTQCGLLHGTAWVRGEMPGKSCTKWAAEDPDNSCLHPPCDLPRLHSTNHIDWEIEFVGTDPTEAVGLITWEECWNAFTAVLEDCEYGGDSVFGEWRFKIDPQDGGCPAEE